MKRLFIGGPADGEIMDVPESAGAYMVPDPSLPLMGTRGIVVYNPVRFVAGSSRVTVYVHGDGSSERVFLALLAAAGLEADQ